MTHCIGRNACGLDYVYVSLLSRIRKVGRVEISKPDLDFIRGINKRFPDKKISYKFREFNRTPIADRPALARKKLDKLPRTGYVTRGLAKDRAETVGQHVREMKEVAHEITGFPLDHLDMLIDVHDMAEAIVGDFTPMDDISSEEKHRLEDIAIQVIFEGDEAMIAAWREYAEGSTMQARMAKDIDKLQMWDKAEIYKAAHPELTQDGRSNFQDLIDSVVDRPLNSFGSINTVILYQKRKEKYAVA